MVLQTEHQPNAYKLDVAKEEMYDPVWTIGNSSGNWEMVCLGSCDLREVTEMQEGGE